MLTFNDAEVLVAVCLLEFRLAVDCRVVLAEHTPDEFLVFGSNVLECQFGLYFLEFGHHLLVDLELLLPVGTLVLELNVLAQMLESEQSGHMERRVDTDTQVTMQQFGVHAAHRSADDQIGFLFFDHFLDERNSFGGRKQTRIRADKLFSSLFITLTLQSYV